MQKCKRCGQILESGQTICPNCGFVKPRGGWIFKLIVFVMLVSGSSYYYLNYYKNCHLPIKYSIGNIDPRFKISSEELTVTLKDAESRWDNTLGQNSFEYDPAAKLKINLIYDSRQAEVDNLKSQLATLDSTNQSLDSMNAKIEQLVTNYETDLTAYNNKVATYEASVKYWNAQGGAPSAEYNQLQAEKITLDKTRNSLENRRLAIVKMSNTLNSQTSQYNDNLGDLKNYLDANKNTIVTSGLYYGGENKIDIFTYWDQSELRLVLMHEMGHAFGIDHTTKDGTLMYPVTNKSNLSNPLPQAEDIALVKSACRINK